MWSRTRALASKSSLRSAVLRTASSTYRSSSRCWTTNSLRFSSASPVIDADATTVTPATDTDASDSVKSTTTASEADEPVEPVETISGSKESKKFEAETKQLLDIVAHSLYTDKEVFLRELISNASDALEKCRYLQSSNQHLADGAELRISIRSDPKARTITIMDNGVGMTGSEMTENLGTIARSGSKAFLKQVQETSGDPESAASNIIGQFGVGFYSSFMVADRVDVFSRSMSDEKSHFWSSDGSGSYEMAEADNVRRGTKIILHLRKGCKKFAKPQELTRLVKKHSAFVGFPLHLNGEKLDSVGALWMQSKSSISEEQHKAFFKHISHAYEGPRAHLQFSTDAPIAINALFYVPQRHSEMFGLAKEEQGVHLYSRKVLIQQNCQTILPRWMRFIKGVADSPDIPLNISRENMQDSILIRKLNNVLAKRTIRFLKEMSKEDPAKYKEFYDVFGSFIKEGACADETNRDAIAPLLRFESSVGKPGEVTSLDEYVSRMPASQKNLYFLSVPSRSLAESSPYLEAFKAKGTEVLFLYRDVDELVMESLKEYANRPIKSVQQDNEATTDLDSSTKGGEESTEEPLTPVQQTVEKELPAFFASVLGKKVAQVNPTKRTLSAPALVLVETGVQVRKMMRMMDGSNNAMDMENQKLEINIRHPIIVGLNQLRHSHPELAKNVVEQVFDNALVSAGVLDDSRHMVSRVNSLMQRLVELETAKTESASESPSKQQQPASPDLSAN